MKCLRAAFAVRITEELTDVLHRLKFLDESGVNLGLTRLYGRAAPGQRVVEATPGMSGAHYTLVAALGLKGVQAPLLFEGAMTRLTFEAYIEDVLAPTLRRGEIVLMDNLSAHKSDYVRATLEARGVQVIFLPPYSPDLNPIEKGWAKVKQALRAAKLAPGTICSWQSERRCGRSRPVMCWLGSLIVVMTWRKSNRMPI